MSDEPKGLSFSDVYLIPQYSEISSRKDVDVSTIIGGHKIDVPVISANMDTTTDGNMSEAMRKAGALGAIHRFMTIDQNIQEFKKVLGDPAFVSIGVNGDSKDRAKALFEAGASYFIIDIAHGHSLMMKEMIKWMKNEFRKDVYVMAGNVATRRGALDLAIWGADAIKIGIGPGAVCKTKNVTGVTVPQFSAILAAAETYYPEGTKIVADGGVSEIGDIAKALAAGADMVMCGRMFASCIEAPGHRDNGLKSYRGMASSGAMEFSKSGEKNLPTPEGTEIFIPITGTAQDVVQDIKGGLQSAFSYSNARNLKEFHEKVKWGVRK